MGARIPALLPIILTASHIVLAADAVPKFNVEKTCQPAAAAATLAGRDSSACQRDENDAHTKLEQEWSQYSATQRANRTNFAALDHAPSYVE